MLNVVVLVSGGGTNLQAIIDAVEKNEITNVCIKAVISNNKNAYALERARNHSIEAICISPKDYASRDLFNEALINKIDELGVDLIVLAGCLVVIPKKLVLKYPNKIIMIFLCAQVDKVWKYIE